MTFDLSVGQRLMIGFALMLALCGGVVVAVTRSHEVSARAERDLSENIAPLSEKAFDLERAVVQIAIDTRAYLISPDDLNVDTQRIAVDRMRGVQRLLGAMPKDDAAATLYLSMVSLLNAYVEAADKAMQQRRHGTLGLRPERALGDAREKAVAAIRGFSEYQAMRTRAALANMAEGRERATTEVQVALGLALVLFLCISFVTAQSIRRPARRLVDLARSFGVDVQSPALLLPGLSAAAGAKKHPRDEMTQLARALSDSAAVIAARDARLRARARVAAAAACSMEAGELADAALVVMAEHVRADAGAVYRRRDDVLVPIATYAMDEAVPVRIGEGIAGQAATAGRMLVSDAPIGAESGFEHRPAKTAAAVPLCAGRELLGVLLLIRFEEDIGEPEQAFLRAASVQLAAGLRNAVDYERLAQHAREAGCPAAIEQTEAARRNRSDDASRALIRTPWQV